MSGRPRLVDLGPLYLPVGEEVQRPMERADLADDADRFAALLEAGRPGSAGDRAAQASAQKDDDPSVSDLASHVQNVWDREASGTDGEVRVVPSKDLSPHTTLRLHGSCGTLHVEIHCDASANPAWFIPRLPSLGRDLASRLQRPVCVALFGPGGARIGHFESSEASA
ncbi:hypothetical protein GCM10023165_34160 [Variovorax defluvii]|uniref:Uncharacterized protein n=1 Tax=Variovorax defluvii TaxID=913761 RepID=A0ABP8HZZ2_9BURK